jgi:tripartite-type tricarboxylate transporter receptor subunit TctC
MAWMSWSSAFAQDYPSKPIRVVVPTGSGSGSDVVARHMANALGKAWGTTTIVDNKLGAGGVIGTDFVAKSPPDGYTLLFTYAAHYSNQWVLDKTPFDAVKDFEPIARLAVSCLALVTAPNSPLRSVQDVVAAAKRKANGLTYGSAGNGTTSHMAGALMCSLAGIQMNHVPYKSPGQAAIDAASGQVDLGFGGIATLLPLIRAGRLRALAVTSLNRSAHLPDVVSMAEAGLQGYEVVSPIWVLAPRGTPAPIIAKLSDKLTSVAATPEFRELCAQQGFEVDIQNAATYKANAPAELEKWKRLVALTGQKGQTQ